MALSKKNLVTYSILLSFFVILLLIWLSFGEHGFFSLYKMQKEQERCLAIIKNLKEKNRVLATEIRRLKQDSKYLESLAREQLGMVKENEIIYRLKKKSNDTIRRKIEKNREVNKKGAGDE